MLPILRKLALWLAFDQGRSLRYISVHDLCDRLDQEKINGMLFFHAFTGCDIASDFRNKGKKTAWYTWDIFSEASPVFSKLSQYPLTVEQSDMDILERFVILMFDRYSNVATVDEAKLDLFAKKQRPYEVLPPTKATLLQHTKRAAYQAGCVWGQATLCQPEVESPFDWGWQKSGDN